MQLGNFSISLAVNDLEKPKSFYQSLGFKIIGGEQSQGWLILMSGDHKIGLFQGMFEQNILTFNPGWDKEGNPLNDFDDIRSLHQSLKEKGIEIAQENITKEGPSNFSVIDPDGSPILFDQHV
ncbi:MAG: VOC family protein [Marinicellaceae bacterium]